MYIIFLLRNSNYQAIMKKKQVIGKLTGVPMPLKLRIVNIYSVTCAALICLENFVNISKLSGKMASNKTLE